MTHCITTINILIQQYIAYHASFSMVSQCLLSYIASKIKYFFRYYIHPRDRCHQMSSDVIKCQISNYFTAFYHWIFLQSLICMILEKTFRWTTARRKRHAAIRRRWILCSNEQSKLCFCTTEIILPYKNQLALPNGRGIFLQSRKI